jgi:hypothetical protein
MTETGCGCDSIELPYGPSGNDGRSIYNTTTSAFNQPAVGADVTIVVNDSGSFTNQWAARKNQVSVFDSSGNGGFYEIVSITGANQITIKNLGYTGSSSPTTSIASGAKVVPSGVQGAAGPAGAAGGTGPVGPAGTASTLVRTYVDTSIRAVPNTSGFGLIPTQTFSAPAICPQNGDAGRIKGHFVLRGSGSFSLGRLIDNIDFFIGKTGVAFSAIVPVPSAETSYDSQLQIREIDLKDISNYTFVSFEITIKRISSTSSLILVQWWLSNVQTPGLQGSYVGSSLTTGSVDFNTGSSIDFAVRSSATYTAGGIDVSLASLTVEKIIQ